MHPPLEDARSRLTRGFRSVQRDAACFPLRVPRYDLFMWTLSKTVQGYEQVTCPTCTHLQPISKATGNGRDQAPQPRPTGVIPNRPLTATGPLKSSMIRDEPVPSVKTFSVISSSTLVPCGRIQCNPENLDHLNFVQTLVPTLIWLDLLHDVKSFRGRDSGQLHRPPVYRWGIAREVRIYSYRGAADMPRH